MNLSNIFGTHSVFYFYGVEHLAINMRTYITEGLNNNELTCISMEPALYDEMMKILQISETFPFDHSIMQHFVAALQRGGRSGFREEVLRLTRDAVERGFNGIRCIWQPSAVMPASFLREWRCWEESFTDVLQGTRCSILCLTDMTEMIANQVPFDEEMIQGMLQSHPYMLYQMHLEEVVSLRV